MMHKTVLYWLTILSLAMILGLGGVTLSLARTPAAPVREITWANPERLTGQLEINQRVQGPFVSRSVAMAVFDGDLRDLPQLERGAVSGGEVPRPAIPGKGWPSAPSDTIDPVAQTDQGPGRMPDPIANFEGIYGPEAGGWAPPDTNGDVGTNHYVQTVNVGIGMYDKATGAELVNISFNDFFTGTNTPCDDQNRGDPISLYDPMADRWIISDFSLPSGAPSLECIAVSQSGDPVSGGWYFYAFDASNAQGSWHDYPKLGVWPDAYYMTANMFSPWAGAKVWAFDRTAMLNGDPVVDVVTFDAGTAYGSLLPGNLRGPLPPAGSPNYFASIEFPNLLQLWQFDVDWTNPGNSSFTGPVELTVADFGYIGDIPQLGTGQMLDSLGDRLMMQLQYRNFGSHESLWVNHTVASGGAAGVRWYEVRDPGGSPVVYQQGTYQPADGLYRWMGSLAVDQDGNMALGYSVSSETMHPSIRYTGRLVGDPLGTLPQAETSLIEGAGAQTGTNRWGDYSAMNVDPTDDCTFWYTQEYYEVTSARDWYTRIGSFRFPSCGKPKGWLTGIVYDADTLQAIAGALVVAESPTMTLSSQTDANGQYTMTLPGSTYTLTAGPLMPGYPDPAIIPDVILTAGMTVTVDIPLVPQPYLVEEAAWVDDNVPGGNDNGYPEPGESSLLLWESISNTGATTATNVSAHLIALTPGVTVTIANANYPDVAAGEAQTNLSAFEFSIARTITCGGRLDFQKVVTADQGVYTLPLKLYAGVPLPPAPWFADDMESGSGNWSTGGTNNRWAITEEQSHSPTHAWSDSPNGNYLNNTNAWLQSPVFDLSQAIGLELGFWSRYGLETGYDFGYLEYSLNGGTDWTSLDTFNGFQFTWGQESYDVAVFDEQSSVTFRFRLYSDGGVTEDGWYIDDVTLSYQPFECTYPVDVPGVPALLAPPDGTITGTHVLSLTWEAGPGWAPEGYNLELDGTVITTTATNSATVLASGVHTWRVRAFNLVGYSDWSQAWTVEVLDPPGTPTLLNPPDGAVVTTTQEIEFEWQAGSGGTPDGYHLNVGGQVITSTNYFELVTLDPGIYTWTVRAFNAVGVSDWSETWTVEVVILPGTPIPLYPADGLVVTNTHEISFGWEPGTGGAPDGYNFDLDGTITSTTDTTLTATLEPGTHTWQVQAFNQAGASSYSVSRTVEIIDPPGVPTLLAPADGTITSSRHITFAWLAGTGGTPDGYYLELDGEIFSTTETLTATMLDLGQHNWRVQAYNAAGNSGWSQVWTVQILDLPGTPTLLSPPDGTLTTTQAITLTWQAGAGEPPTSYRLDLDGGVMTTTEPTWAGSLDLGAHTWRVQAFNAAGASAWTEAWTIEITQTISPPGVPTLLSPPDGSLTTTHTLNFLWQAGSGEIADGYHLELNGQVITTTATIYSATLDSGNYAWRVRAFNAAGISNWTDTWSVTVAYQVYLPIVMR